MAGERGFEPPIRASALWQREWEAERSVTTYRLSLPRTPGRHLLTADGAAGSTMKFGDRSNLNGAEASCGRLIQPEASTTTGWPSVVSPTP